jgi:ABC-type phosphate transport system ATPase subunit
MTKEEIIKFLHMLNDKLVLQRIKGEVCLYGDAVMCVAFDARPSTKDVGAVFQPTKQIRDAAVRIAREHNLREDWLNDGVKGFLTDHAQTVFLNMPNLKVYIPSPDYSLAMKNTFCAH